mgnify:CR=1 FL=1
MSLNDLYREYSALQSPPIAEKKRAASLQRAYEQEINGLRREVSEKRAAQERWEKQLQQNLQHELSAAQALGVEPAVDVQVGNPLAPPDFAGVKETRERLQQWVECERSWEFFLRDAQQRLAVSEDLLRAQRETRAQEEAAKRADIITFALAGVGVLAYVLVGGALGVLLMWVTLGIAYYRLDQGTSWLMLKRRVATPAAPNSAKKVPFNGFVLFIVGLIGSVGSVLGLVATLARVDGWGGFLPYVSLVVAGAAVYFGYERMGSK